MKYIRLPGEIKALIKLNDLLRSMLLGTLKLWPLSILLSETGVLAVISRSLFSDSG